jgi:hypothetical protein
MANYTKVTNFTAKDALTTGDPNKVVRGAEIDVELTAISTAIATKSNSANPTFTGTVVTNNLTVNGTFSGTIAGGTY